MLMQSLLIQKTMRKISKWLGYMLYQHYCELHLKKRRMRYLDMDNQIMP